MFTYLRPSRFCQSDEFVGFVANRFGTLEGGRSWARFASLIGSCKMNGVEPYAYLRDLFTRLAGGHLDKDTMR